VLDRPLPGLEEQTSACKEPGSTSPGPAKKTNGKEACSKHTGQTSPTTPTSATSQTHHASTFSAGDSHAKISAWQASGQDSQETEACSPLSTSGSQSLFSPVGYSWKTYQGCCQAIVEETWPDSSTKWGPLAMGGPTGLSMLDTSAYRSAGGESSSVPVEPILQMILERQPDSRYELSGKAAAGILRRAGRRGRKLPPMLEEALKRVAETQ